jgi:hypothetical protein
MIEKDPPKRMAFPGSLSPQGKEGFPGRLFLLGFSWATPGQAREVAKMNAPE